MRRAFTLIELLVVIAIIGIGATAATLEYTSGREGARLKGAARDIYATMRVARAKALVMREPCIVTYSSTTINGQVSAKVEITAAQVFTGEEGGTATTLKGEVVRLDGSDEEPVTETKRLLVKEEGKPDETTTTTERGETAEEILFAPIDDAVLEGICIKVEKGDETTETVSDDEAAKAKISVFSNVDYLIGKLKGAQAEAKKESESAASDTDAKASGEASEETDRQERVDVVWGVNGRCDPHQVWVYRAGTKPDSGLLIKVDRFGAPKIVSAEDGE